MLQIPTALRIGAIESLGFEIIEANTPFIEKDKEERMQPRVGSTCHPAHDRKPSAATSRQVYGSFLAGAKLTWVTQRLAARWPLVPPVPQGR